jgi:hypothetical protein
VNVVIDDEYELTDEANNLAIWDRLERWKKSNLNTFFSNSLFYHV